VVEGFMMGPFVSPALSVEIMQRLQPATTGLW
jgi:hypothetical protein